MFLLTSTFRDASNMKRVEAYINSRLLYRGFHGWSRFIFFFLAKRSTHTVTQCSSHIASGESGCNCWRSFSTQRELNWTECDDDVVCSIWLSCAGAAVWCLGDTQRSSCSDTMQCYRQRWTSSALAADLSRHQLARTRRQLLCTCVTPCRRRTRKSVYLSSDLCRRTELLVPVTSHTLLSFDTDLDLHTSPVFTVIQTQLFALLLGLLSTRNLS